MLMPQFSEKNNEYKVRIVGDGSNQDPLLYPKSTTSGPTAYIQSILILIAIAAYCGMMIFTADVSGAYLHASLPETTRIVLRLPKDIASVMTQMKPEWQEHLTDENTLFVRLRGALYGLKESGLLWHIHAAQTMTDIGFTQSRHDPCAYIPT